jgi:hypothetical protein
MIGFILDSDFVDYNLSQILETHDKLSIRPADPKPLVLVKIKFSQKLDWIGSFDLTTLKDGKHHFKPQYSLFSPFEDEFK